ncbi:hypothetical protein HNR42_002511 [Deinobacterium chartae]|uniref:Lipocalin-like domain-containing protein n=1 Tax=Deinobacterium chartae TaxID=521158 RepID=A0A841I5C3_9DEIO|nr:hypothetical protein [Deinobacterium chartae]MBB6099075.1 hypothetical protein [Deinobacterium chartae]
MRTVLLALVAGALLTAGTLPDGRLDREDLTGVWQNRPSLGAGWGDVYVFYPNGRVEFRISQFDCESRNRGKSGRWRLEGQKVHIYFQTRLYLDGGALEPALGSCSTALSLEGAVERERPLRYPRHVVLEAKVLKDASPYPVIKLNNLRFWKLSPDPSGYP